MTFWRGAVFQSSTHLPVSINSSSDNCVSGLQCLWLSGLQCWFFIVLMTKQEVWKTSRNKEKINTVALLKIIHRRYNIISVLLNCLSLPVFFQLCIFLYIELRNSVWQYSCSVKVGLFTIFLFYLQSFIIQARKVKRF